MRDSDTLTGSDIAYMTIPREKTDARYAEWYTASGRRSILVRPDNKGTTRACLSFVPTESDLASDGGEWKAILYELPPRKVLDGDDRDPA